MMPIFHKTIILALALIMSVTGYADNVKINGIFYELNKTTKEATVKRGLLTSNYASYKGDIEIPSYITYNDTTYIVTSIGKRAFAYYKDINSVTIPNSVTKIAEGSFCGCEKITSITIPESVKYIGEDAFRDCHSITSIYIPKSVIHIGEDAFTNCKSLTSIKVDKDNTKYDSRNDCNGIINTSTNEFIKGCANSTIPESVTSIGKNAFSSCKNLYSINIPQSVKTIGEGAFADCNSLKSVTIHDSVTSIGAKAFWDCGFSSFKIPSNLTYIGSEAFIYTNIEHITIPASLTNIDPNAFQYCINLKSVTNLSKIPQKITFYTFQKEDTAHGPVTIVPVNNGDTSTEHTQHIEQRKKADPIILFVPKNCKEAYQKAEGWKLFKIEELEQ